MGDTAGRFYRIPWAELDISQILSSKVQLDVLPACCFEGCKGVFVDLIGVNLRV